MREFQWNIQQGTPSYTATDAMQYVLTELQHKLSCSCIYSLVLLILPHVHTFSLALSPQTVNIYSSLDVRDQTSHPHKTTVKINILEVIRVIEM